MTSLIKWYICFNQFGMLSHYKDDQDYHDLQPLPPSSVMTTTVVAGPAPSGFSTSKLTRYWVNTSRSLIVNSVTLGPLILTLISEVRSASLFKYGGLKRTLKPSRNNDTLNWWRQLKQSEINFFYKFFLSVVKRNAFVPNIFSGTQMFKTIWSSWGKPQHSSQILDVTTWPNTDGSGHTGNIAHSITHCILCTYLALYVSRYPKNSPCSVEGWGGAQAR